MSLLVTSYPVGSAAAMRAGGCENESIDVACSKDRKKAFNLDKVVIFGKFGLAGKESEHTTFPFSALISLDEGAYCSSDFSLLNCSSQPSQLPQQAKPSALAEALHYLSSQPGQTAGIENDNNLQLKEHKLQASPDEPSQLDSCSQETGEIGNDGFDHSVWEKAKAIVEQLLGDIASPIATPATDAALKYLLLEDRKKNIVHGGATTSTSVGDGLSPSFSSSSRMKVCTESMLSQSFPLPGYPSDDGFVLPATTPLVPLPTPTPTPSPVIISHSTKSSSVPVAQLRSNNSNSSSSSSFEAREHDFKQLKTTREFMRETLSIKAREVLAAGNTLLTPAVHVPGNILISAAVPAVQVPQVTQQAAKCSKRPLLIPSDPRIALAPLFDALDKQLKNAFPNFEEILALPDGLLELVPRVCLAELESDCNLNLKSHRGMNLNTAATSRTSATTAGPQVSVKVEEEEGKEMEGKEKEQKKEGEFSPCQAVEKSLLYLQEQYRMNIEHNDEEEEEEEDIDELHGELAEDGEASSEDVYAALALLVDHHLMRNKEDEEEDRDSSLKRPTASIASSPSSPFNVSPTNEEEGKNIDDSSSKPSAAEDKEKEENDDDSSSKDSATETDDMFPIRSKRKRRTFSSRSRSSYSVCSADAGSDITEVPAYRMRQRRKKNTK